MRDAWGFTLMALGASMLGVLVVALAVVEVLMAHAPDAVFQPGWTTHLAKADAAMERARVDDAVSHWRAAHDAALRSRQWEGLIETGDAYLRIGQHAGFGQAGQGRAREAYLAALLRARREGSLEGVLRAARAFAELGDTEVVEQSLRIAEELAAKTTEPGARERVRRATEGWARDGNGKRGR